MNKVWIHWDERMGSAGNRFAYKSYGKPEKGEVAGCFLFVNYIFKADLLWLLFVPVERMTTE